MKNLPFRKSANKSTSTFELVHLDIVGFVQESLHGNEYFLTILDDYSCFGWVYFLEGKNDTFNKFHIWTNEIFSTNQLSIYALTMVKNLTTVIITHSAYLKASFTNSMYLIIQVERPR